MNLERRIAEEIDEAWRIHRRWKTRKEKADLSREKAAARRQKAAKKKAKKKAKAMLSEWRLMVEMHRWRRLLELEVVPLPGWFDGESLPTDRYSSLGGGTDQVGSRMRFARDVLQQPAPCRLFDRLPSPVFVLLLAEGCSCSDHAGDLDYWAEPLEDLLDLQRRAENSRK
jgi:hypothetical protein